MEINKFVSNFNIRLKTLWSFLPCPCLFKCNLFSLLSHFSLKYAMETVDRQFCVTAKPAPGLLSSPVTLLSAAWCSDFSSCRYTPLWSWTVLVFIYSLMKGYWVPTVCEARSAAEDWERSAMNKTRHCLSHLAYALQSMTLHTSSIQVTCTPKNTCTLLTSTLKEPSTWGNKTGKREGQWVAVGRRIFLKKT